MTAACHTCQNPAQNDNDTLKTLSDVILCHNHVIFCIFKGPNHTFSIFWFRKQFSTVSNETGPLQGVANQFCWRHVQFSSSSDYYYTGEVSLLSAL